MDGRASQSERERAPVRQQVRDGATLKQAKTDFERAFILDKLEEYQWNVSKTAETLDVERTHLHKKMKLLGIARGG